MRFGCLGVRKKKKCRSLDWGMGWESNSLEFWREEGLCLTMAPNTMWSILSSLSSEVPSSDDSAMRVILWG